MIVDIPERYIIKIFEQMKNYFSPKIIGEVDDVYIKLVRIKGNDIPLHMHENEDEMFLVVRGSLKIEIENMRSFVLGESEFYIVKKGIRHRAYSDDECWLVLIEKKSTQHTGNINSKITVSIEEPF